MEIVNEDGTEPRYNALADLFLLISSLSTSLVTISFVNYSSFASSSINQQLRSDDYTNGGHNQDEEWRAKRGAGSREKEGRRER